MSPWLFQSLHSSPSPPSASLQSRVIHEAAGPCPASLPSLEHFMPTLLSIPWVLSICLQLILCLYFIPNRKNWGLWANSPAVQGS